MKLTQNHRSVLALIFTAAFLITGKLFVWKQSDASNLSTGDPLDSVAEQLPDESGLSTTATTFTTTVVTTTVTTTIPDHFETYPPDAPPPDANTDADISTDTDISEEITFALTTITEATEAPEPENPPLNGADGMVPAPDGYFNDALFIGDSRTVGQACYSPIAGATYFATVGLSTYKLDDAVSEVPGTEGLNFSTVLSMKQYSKVYIMLGINELGNDFSYTMQNFRNLIARIQSAQPGAIIYLEANLHVSASRHYSDAVVNNTRINGFNAELAALADNQSIFYLDVNPVFDDAQGCLMAEYTSDGTHPYAKHYADWQAFLMQNTAVQ